jgi:hypothetical protein
MIEELKAIIQQQEDSGENAPEDGWYGDETDEEKENYDGDMIHQFPNGDHSVICTTWADDIRERLGEQRVALFGYDGTENPDTPISKIADGHDFAIVDGRYIVDGWVKYVEVKLEAQGVYDIENDDDLSEIMRLYGEPATWEARDNEVADPAGAIREKFIERMDDYRCPVSPAI